VKLTEQEKEKIIELIQAGKQLPSIYKSKLFNSGETEFIEATKDYKLVYKGKERKEDIIAQTPVAPFQMIRTFNGDNRFEDGWRNMLIFGDNLMALKTIYEDQRGPNIYKTKNRIKLIYIDPPFATKQDFMKDREKAYRDKIIGAQFIEFLRKRLILLREILADDGSIYVHLDWKKGHYLKSIMDEVFGEHNFQNEIVWQQSTAHNMKANGFVKTNASIFFYSKSESHIFNEQYTEYGKAQMSRYKTDENGRLYKAENLTFSSKSPKRQFEWRGTKPPKNRSWGADIEQLEKWWNEGKILKKKDGTPRQDGLKIYYEETQGGTPLTTNWTDIERVGNTSSERVDYPTQKPEKLLERVIRASTNVSITGKDHNNDIVLDTFAGSGTTLAVAEKLKCRWIGMDSGKLAIYTMQRRMLNLTTRVGSKKEDERRDYERVDDFKEHSISKSRGLFFVYEQARKGDLIITDSFLKNLSEFVSENLSGDMIEEYSLICPEEKLKVKDLELMEDEAGGKIIQVGRVKFLVSFIQPKEKTEKEKPLRAKEFVLYHAGVYDNKRILEMPWQQYKPFVLQLFGVRVEPHTIHSFQADGYVGIYSVFIWDYPNQKKLVLDEEYVKTLHHVLGGKAGNKFYVVAPIVAMGFMEDEITIDDTTYVFLKVPLSVLMALIEKGEPGSLRQPTREKDVNEVIDAIGFDFISQPEVKAVYTRKNPKETNLFNAKKRDYVVNITYFKSNTLVYDPEDFDNFETLSMVLVDLNYNDDYFNLDKVFWADQIVDEEKMKAEIRIGEDDFTGKKMMIIYMDKYGNELKVIKAKKDFK
jgi:DNA modification methylase